MEEMTVKSPTKEPGQMPRTARAASLLTLTNACSRSGVLRLAGMLAITCVAVVLPTSVEGIESDSTQNRQSVDGSSPEIIRLEILPGNTDRPVVTALELSPSGRYLAAAGDDHAVRILELAVAQADLPAAPFTASTLNPNASLESQSNNEMLRNELEPVSRHTWRSHSDWVRAVRFSPSGLLVASCGNDGQIVVYDVATREIIVSTRVDHALQDLCFIDDKTIYAIGFHANVYRWDLAQSRPTVDHQADCRDLRTIQYSSELKMLAYGGRDGVLRLYRMQGDRAELYALAPAHFQRVRSLHFLNDQQTLLSVGEDRRLIQFDINSKAIVSTLDFPGGKLFGLASIDSNQLAIGGSDNTIRLLDSKTGQCGAKLIGHDGTVTLLHSQGNVLVSSSFDTTIRIWNVERAARECDEQKRYHHPVAAQFEDSGALEKPGILVSRPIK